MKYESCDIVPVVVVVAAAVEIFVAVAKLDVS
jgi:hypothetical protein